MGPLLSALTALHTFLYFVTVIKSSTHVSVMGSSALISRDISDEKAKHSLILGRAITAT